MGNRYKERLTRWIGQPFLSYLLLNTLVFVVIAIIGTSLGLSCQKVHHFILVQILGTAIGVIILVIIVEYPSVKNAVFTAFLPAPLTRGAEGGFAAIRGGKPAPYSPINGNLLVRAFPEEHGGELFFAAQVDETAAFDEQGIIHVIAAAQHGLHIAHALG